MSATERITGQLDKTPEQILDELFEYESPWDRKGQAFVAVEFRSKQNPSHYWGSFKTISREVLNRHNYSVSITSTWPRSITVKIHGVVYDEEARALDPPFK